MYVLIYGVSVLFFCLSQTVCKLPSPQEDSPRHTARGDREEQESWPQRERTACWLREAWHPPVSLEEPLVTFPQRLVSSSGTSSVVRDVEGVMAQEAEPTFRPRGAAFHQSCVQSASSLGGADHIPISQSAEAPSGRCQNSSLSTLRPTVVSSDGCLCG